MGSQAVVKGQSLERVCGTEHPHLKKCAFYDLDYFKKNSP